MDSGNEPRKRGVFKRFGPYHPNQLMLLPSNLRDWLPEDRPVYFISALVDELELSASHEDYAE